MITDEPSLPSVAGPTVTEPPYDEPSLSAKTHENVPLTVEREKISIPVAVMAPS
jgi:hypothetical protein